MTEKQKKILKTTMVIAGGTVCIVGGAKIISRTKLGEMIKDRIIEWAILSKCNVNGCDLEMTTFVANRVCSDAMAVKKEEVTIIGNGTSKS